MNQKKVELREIRLNRVQAQVAARDKALKERGLDEKQIKKDSTRRSLLAEVRKLRRSIESLRWEPPQAVQAEKPEKPEKSEKSKKPKKPAKDAASSKAPKPPKEKKLKQEDKTPPA